MNVAISPELKSRVDRLIAEGQYASSSEYVRDLMEQRLADPVREGLESPEEPAEHAAYIA
jgi:Arc/MetJ-type ribon-helix-helix transcriptional regulator